ncbi:MAG: UDP-3-O-(3-hydroxymyristoyl)glucosamine N-acyltransferase [Planctomycetota bacterium]|nr:UDP-3-O-(3-hydroxymyristoyl)glucosamine N-acyltransferase [Planctomycetota bacterium]
MKEGWTVGKLAKFVGGSVEGDASTPIRGVSGLSEADAGDISFLANKRYEPLLAKTHAAAVVVAHDTKVRANLPRIRVMNPDEAFGKIVARLCPPCAPLKKGVHRTAVVSAKAQLGKGVAIGQNVVIESGAVIGDRSVIYANCYIGHDSSIGPDSVMYPNVVVRERCRLGARVIIHSGAVIGSDGFGYADVNGDRLKIPQLGTVLVGDDVEVGANVTIARARFGRTTIGNSTKIDNLVHIAHNVTIGDNCILVAQTGIAGSSRVGKRCILAGQSGVNGHVEVGDGVTIAARAGVTKSIPAGTIVSGFPARPIRQFRREQVALRKFPEMWKLLKQLSDAIARLVAATERGATN